MKVKIWIKDRGKKGSYCYPYVMIKKCYFHRLIQGLHSVMPKKERRIILKQLGDAQHDVHETHNHDPKTEQSKKK